mmetsp:Transcript_25433/g.76380  ORF Transcript_25433/g.76380 Transcript_25433/m.76380 type:complete len:391 (-) Transcript_25433:37-1209(-)
MQPRRLALACLALPLLWFRRPAAAPVATETCAVQTPPRNATKGCHGVRILANFHKSGNKFTGLLKRQLAERSTLVTYVDSVADGGALRARDFGPLRELDRSRRRDRVKVVLLNVRNPDFAIDGFRCACPGARLVIFVRDPVGLVLSGYNYHRQRPAPEEWIDRRLAGAYPCVETADGGVVRNTTGEAGRWRRLRAACEALALKYGAELKADKRATRTYGDLLNAADPKDGLLLEFYRTVIGPVRSNRLMAEWSDRIVAFRARKEAPAVFLSSMDAYYAAPAAVVRCLVAALQLPFTVGQPGSVAKIVLGVTRSIEASKGADTRHFDHPKDEGAPAPTHVTTGTFNKTRQAELLLSDAAARATLLEFRARVGRVFARGPACGAVPGEGVFR